MSWSQKSVLGFTFVCILLSCPKWLFVYFKMVDHNISFSDPSKSNHSISEMFLVFFWISIYRFLSLKYSPSNLLFIFGIIIFKNVYCVKWTFLSKSCQMLEFRREKRIKSVGSKASFRFIGHIKCMKQIFESYIQ